MKMIDYDDGQYLLSFKAKELYDFINEINNTLYHSKLDIENFRKPTQKILTQLTEIALDIEEAK